MFKSAVHSKESLLVALLLAMNTGFVDAFTFFILTAVSLVSKLGI